EAVLRLKVRNLPLGRSSRCRWPRARPWIGKPRWRSPSPSGPYVRRFTLGWLHYPDLLVRPNMRTEIENRLIMTKSLVSARRAASSDDRYAWVWVAPLRDGTFKVSTVELAKQLVDEDVCFFEDD